MTRLTETVGKIEFADIPQQAAKKPRSVRFRIPCLREGRLFETRSGGALLSMRCFTDGIKKTPHPESL